VFPQYEWVDASYALRGGGKAEVRASRTAPAIKNKKYNNTRTPRWGQC
jgi:hypothetical protein